jgi:DUF4097 and DUF4098 domain-containing protein YvlB
MKIYMDDGTEAGVGPGVAAAIPPGHDVEVIGDEPCGDLRVNAANGNIAVDVAHAGVVAKSANGDVRLGEVARGSVVLETQLGDLQVGIREGTAAWLDVSAKAGKVHNALDAADAPEPSAETVEVRARTSAGNVAIQRPLTSAQQHTPRESSR